MEVKEVILDKSENPLRFLRDSIVGRFHHRIAVIEIPIGDSRCGFLVFDEDTGEAIWTGDGFRSDGYEEGGAGYFSANAIFRIFGIRQLFWEPVNPDEIIGAEEGKVALTLIVIACAIGEILEPGDFLVPAEKNPSYVRNLNLVFDSSKKMGNLDRRGGKREGQIENPIRGMKE